MLFSRVFFETTHPLTPYSRLAQLDVLVSILFHTVSYLLIVYIFSFLFSLKIKQQTYVKLSIFLLVVMSFGYIGRLYRIKNNYKYLIKNHDDEDALQITNMLTYNGYYTYYFLG